MILIDEKYQHFLALEKEKRERVLSAAFREFGRFGYAKTSVEQVAKAAGISKGMVFHYFQSKQGLYEYLSEYVNQFVEQFFEEMESGLPSVDYIEQYRMVTKIKMKAYTLNPSLFEFVSMLYLHQDNLEASKKTKDHYEKLIKKREYLLDRMVSESDTSLFRGDMDVEKIKQYITWMINGYIQTLLFEVKGRPLADIDVDPIWKEFDEVLDDLKKVFYRNDWEEKQ